MSPAASHSAALFTAGELARRIGGEVRGDEGLRLTALDTLESAGPSSLSFIRDAARLAEWPGLHCGAALVSRSLLAEPDPGPLDQPGRALILVDDADLALVRILEMLAPSDPVTPGVHKGARVDPSASVADSASVAPGVSIGAHSIVAEHAVIHPGAVIGAEVLIGPRTVVHANAVVRDRCVLGAGVVLHPGVVIGADGFGYRPDPAGRGLVKIPHIGNVVVEDMVEIGANTTVDRAKFGSTRIGAGTKIDNLVQIGHNCRIGRSCIICGMVGLAGSVTLGDGVTLAGGVGVADNRTIGPGATIGARSGVMDDIPPGETWVGYPARPARHTMRLIAAIEQLPDLLSRFRKQLRNAPD